MKNMLSWITKALVSLLLLVGVSAFAAQDPSDFVRGMVGNLQKEVNDQHLSLNTTPDELYKVVQKVIMPDVAVNRMAGMTLGPKWRSASKDQRSKFVDEFSLLLTRTYSNALLKVTDYNFEIYPPRDKSFESAREVIVNGVIRPKSGGDGSSVAYYLERTKEGWKIYDFAVEGVSFASNFRSQFDQYSSIDDLLGALNRMNGASK
ncbi:MAG: ABC transporter substrate-binding protein [Gammaproteobacteria bacterium]|nr:ABC transporter substrate-binding protein [Gammaproteobacteria bacterium]